MFDVAAERYDQFMGRFSRLLSPQMADLAGLRSGHRAIDVGCGPGALASVLVERLGADAVAAVDPSEPFVAAARTRNAGADVRRASAEALPFTWWEPFTLGVGPAGAYVGGLDPGQRDALRDRCRAHLPSGPFTIEARAWAARGVV